MRSGIGYDIHPLVPDRKLILGGVNIPFHLGLEGHSDGDVLTHAIIDAILGGLNCGDMGRIFGIDDPKYIGISSLILLSEVAQLLKEKEFVVHYIDATIVAQQPYLTEYIAEMEEHISKTLQIQSAYVSIKSTTAKGLDAIGRSEGIACYTIATLSRG